MPHIVLSRELTSRLDGGHEETPAISESFFWLGFGVKQIVNSLLFLFLHTHIELNFIPF